MKVALFPKGSSMKILLLIDSLEAGGAQRQICLLGRLLKERSHDVELITYFPHDFYHYLIEGIIPWTCLTWENKWQRIWAIRSEIRRRRPDVVIAFLETASFHAELSTPFRKRFRLIVSERNFDHHPYHIRFLRKILFHILADRVVCNAFAQANLLWRMAPWLRSRISTVPNGLDFDRFTSDGVKPVKRKGSQIRMGLVLARYAPQKNGERFLRCIRAVLDNGRTPPFRVDWYGNSFFFNGKPTTLSGEFLKLLDLRKQLGLTDVVGLHEKHPSPEALYHKYDFFCLPSVHEGCPNTIAEAMACGLPIAAGDIVDNARYIEDGMNGVLFDPYHVPSMTTALEKLLIMSDEQMLEMGHQGHKRANGFFSNVAYVDGYESLLRRKP